MRRKKIENLIEGMWSRVIVGERGKQNRHPCLMNKKRRTNDGGLGREMKKKKQQWQVHNINIEDNSELTYLYSPLPCWARVISTFYTRAPFQNLFFKSIYVTRLNNTYTPLIFIIFNTLIQFCILFHYYYDLLFFLSE